VYGFQKNIRNYFQYDKIFLAKKYFLILILLVLCFLLTNQKYSESYKPADLKSYLVLHKSNIFYFVFYFLTTLKQPMIIVTLIQTQCYGFERPKKYFSFATLNRLIFKNGLTCFNKNLWNLARFQMINVKSMWQIFSHVRKMWFYINFYQNVISRCLI
jgi:hypothetical protein